MKKLFMLLSLTLFFVACSDDDKPNTGNGNGAAGYTHNELATKFVEELNLNQDFEVELVKSSTNQWNFIVIYDPLLDSYDAIEIADYDPAIHGAADYYFDNSHKHYFDLDYVPGHYEERETYSWNSDDTYDVYTEDVYIKPSYYDRYTDISFEKVSATPKDLAKVAAIKEVVVLEKQAKFLSSQFGLSLDRGKEVARLTAHWKKASLKGMTSREHDHFSTELLGFSISEGKAAVNASLSGEGNSLNQLIEKAAQTNGITPEHTKKLLNQIFNL